MTSISVRRRGAVSMTGVATVVSAVLGVAGAAPAAATHDQRCADMPVVAHRGVTTDGAVENTAASVQAALDRGVGFEIDVRTLADGRLVAMHDARLERTTTGVGEVAATTSEELSLVTTDDGQTVPYVHTVLQLVRADSAARVVLDLKALSAAGLRRLGAKIARMGIAHQVSVISFRDALIGGFRKHAPEVATFRIRADLPAPELAATYGGVTVWGHLVTDDWVSSMRRARVPFSVRIADDPAMWSVAVATGSRWVMTDDVDAYRAWCAA